MDVAQPVDEEGDQLEGDQLEGDELPAEFSSAPAPLDEEGDEIEGDELPAEFSVGPKPGKPLSPRQIGTMASVTKGAMEMSVEEDGDAAARDVAVRGGSGGGSSDANKGGAAEAARAIQAAEAARALQAVERAWAESVAAAAAAYVSEVNLSEQTASKPETQGGAEMPMDAGGSSVEAAPAAAVSALQWLQQAEERLAEEMVLSGPLTIHSEHALGLWTTRSFSLWKNAAGAALHRPARYRSKRHPHQWCCAGKHELRSAPMALTRQELADGAAAPGSDKSLAMRTLPWAQVGAPLLDSNWHTRVGCSACIQCAGPVVAPRRRQADALAHLPVRILPAARSERPGVSAMARRHPPPRLGASEWHALPFRAQW